MNKCEHQDFQVMARIGRITSGEGGPVTSYMADITVKCADCKQPFEFIGVPMGLIWDGPACSPDMQELRIPLTPAGEVMVQEAAVPGFRIHQHGTS